MKEVGLGIALIVFIGIGGFLYRNAVERVVPSMSGCTSEAQICPDGTAVGRTGPSCSFAPCPIVVTNTPGTAPAGATSTVATTTSASTTIPELP